MIDSTAKRRIRVAHIITSLIRGGAETMLFKLAASLSPSEGFCHSVLALTGDVHYDFDSLGVPATSLGLSRRALLPAALWRLRRRVQAMDPDIVQGWMYHGNIAARFAAAGSIPIAFNIRHSLHALNEEEPLMRALIRLGARLARGRTACVVYCSETSMTQHEAIGYPAFKSIHIPNGFDHDCFVPASGAKQTARTDSGLELPEHALVVGHVARFHPMKNHIGLIDGFARTILRHPNAHLVMVGRGVDCTNLELVQAVERHGLMGRVHLLGEHRQIDRLLPAFDLLVSSSSWGEAFPNVLGEAMSCGVPCVATDVGDSAAILGDTGRVVSPDDVEALASAMIAILGLSPQERFSRGLAARKRIIAQYGLKAVAARYAQMYRQLLTTPGHTAPRRSNAM